MYEFKIGQSVYLKTDPEQQERIITGILLRENSVEYEVSYIESSKLFYALEITKEPNIGKKVI